MSTIFLYVKQHNLTGLKYFGKTTRKDPARYLGSGKYWKRHIKKYGYDISTINIWSFNTLEEASEFAIKFSVEHNIVESSEWANLIIENAADGGVKGYKHTKESRLKMSESSKGNQHRKGKSFTDESLLKMSKAHTGKILTETHKNNISASKQVYWSNEQRAKHSALQKGRGTGSNNSQHGKKWMTDGVISKSVYPEEAAALAERGFKPGRVTRKRCRV